MLSTKIENTFTISPNGVKIVVADKNPISLINEDGKSIGTKHIKRNGSAVAFYVCGFCDELYKFGIYGNSPYVTIFKTEKEAIDFCKNKVIWYKELYSKSTDIVGTIIAKNISIKENINKAFE